MKIAVIGNALSLFNTTNGHIIDSCDEVIRFNKGCITKPKCQGTKTTIFTFSYQHQSERTKHWTKGTVKWDTTSWKEERTILQSILQAKPSNGLLVLFRLANNPTYQDAEVHIFGFDWKQTPTWYLKHDGKGGHDYAKEKEYCMNLIKTMKWELH